MDWDIKPSGVRGILLKTGSAAEGFQKASKALETTLPNAAKHAGTLSFGGGEGTGMGPIAAALAELMASHNVRLTFIGARTNASIKGAIGRDDGVRERQHRAGGERPARDFEGSSGRLLGGGQEVSGEQPVNPCTVPTFTGDLEALEQDYAAITAAAGTFRDAGANVDSEFQGLSAFYSELSGRSCAESTSLKSIARVPLARDHL
ncbi:DUF6507 family protein [Streptomyces lavendulae]|uniref:DUF6507 family protein n=1 Tax=Streptomyces lavendulae TaxID=1914 RepID=UPI003F4CE5E9